MRVVRFAAVMLAAFLAGSCSSTYRSMSAQEKREFLVELEKETLAELVEDQPEAQADLDKAIGHAIFSNTAAKVPFVGAGDGIGVVVNKETGERSYLKVTRFDVGGGLGVRSYRLVIFFFEEEALKKLSGGKLEFGAGVEAGVKDQDIGTGAGGIAGSRKDGYVLYQLSDSGASVSLTVRMIRYSVLDLSDEP
jgi:lipid-binding SYLF domain-containing protein